MQLNIKIALLIILIIYIYSYYNYPKRTQLIQTRLDNFNYDVLYNRQPVIIQDKDIELAQLQKKWFYLNIVTPEFIIPKQPQSQPQPNDKDIWHTNKFKYLLLQAQESGEILLYPASKKMISGIPDPNESLLVIQISQGQLIILPFHWKYLLNIDVKCLGVNDLVSYFLP
jgi:hypothetical protein